MLPCEVKMKISSVDLLFLNLFFPFHSQGTGIGSWAEQGWGCWAVPDRHSRTFWVINCPRGSVDVRFPLGPFQTLGIGICSDRSPQAPKPGRGVRWRFTEMNHSRSSFWIQFWSPGGFQLCSAPGGGWEAGRGMVRESHQDCVW